MNLSYNHIERQRYICYELNLGGKLRIPAIGNVYPTGDKRHEYKLTI